jgi:hypothetical protein
MVSKALRTKLREYGATVSRDGRTLRLAANVGNTGGPAVEYRVALDGTVSRRAPPEEVWYLVAPDEMVRGVLSIWLSEPIPLKGGKIGVDHESMTKNEISEGKKIPIGTICVYCGSGHPIGKEREFEACFGGNVKLPIQDFGVAAKIAEAREKFEKEATFESWDPYFALVCPACGTVVGVLTRKDLSSEMK